MMTGRTYRAIALALAFAGLLAGAAGLPAGPGGPTRSVAPVATGGDGGAREGVVQCANLIYGQNKTSVCFSDAFLAKVQRDTLIRTNRRFYPVKLDSQEMFQYPFALMTGEGNFTLTPAQRRNLRTYVLRGAFLVASAGCSSTEWDASFRAEFARTFPDMKFQKLPMSHPIFRTVYEIKQLQTKHPAQAYLEALEVNGKIVLVYSREGLNDTSNAGPGCCCCGGNEILNAQQVNVNLLAYALTH